MNESINSFSAAELFWIRFTERVISLGFAELPQDVHFSIAFNKESSEVNLHVTRNTGDQGNKPKIEIVRIGKQTLQTLAQPIVTALFSQILEPIIFKTWERKSKYYYEDIHVLLLSMNELDNNTQIEKVLKDAFQKISKIKRRRLTLKGDIESTLNDVIKNPEIQHIFKNKRVQRLPRRLFQETSFGYLISHQFSGLALFNNGQWHAIRDDHSLSRLLHSCMDSALVKSIIFKTLMAIARISKADSYEAVKKNNRSIRLFDGRSGRTII
jgi:hypothetical protein